jgi:hypothetical protein
MEVFINREKILANLQWSKYLFYIDKDLCEVKMSQQCAYNLPGNLCCSIGKNYPIFFIPIFIISILQYFGLYYVSQSDVDTSHNQSERSSHSELRDYCVGK